MSTKNILWASLICCLLCATGCSFIRQDSTETGVSSQPPQQKVSREIILVPLGDFPAAKVEALVKYYQDKFNLKVKSVPPVKIDPKVMDQQRHQLIAEDILEMMQWGYPRLSGDPRAVMIGLTDVDMFIRQNNWRFTFSWRQYERFAVVSDARMSLGAVATKSDISSSRLRKMVTKNIGNMYYGLCPNDDPHSVLYNGVGGLEDLDYMGEDF